MKQILNNKNQSYILLSKSELVQIQGGGFVSEFWKGFKQAIEDIFYPDGH
jgi:hypothetical protein